jgi:hypothetical protein
MDSPCLVALDTSQEQGKVDEAFQEQDIADDHVEAFPALERAFGNGYPMSPVVSSENINKT